MNQIKSIGLIETLGMVGAVEAADAALKAANVTLLGYELNKAGYVTIKLSGDVSAVQAAVSSGAATAQQLGNLVATHVLPRPDLQVIGTIIKSPDNVPPFSTPGDPAPVTPPPVGPKSPGGQAKEAAKVTKPIPEAKPAAKPADKPAVSKAVSKSGSKSSASNKSGSSKKPKSKK